MKNYLETFSDTATCPIRQVLDRLSDKWSMLIILVLSHEEKMRFNELHRSIGDISQKMLTVALRSLEADGLVSRKIYPEIPPQGRVPAHRGRQKYCASYYNAFAVGSG